MITLQRSVGGLYHQQSHVSAPWFARPPTAAPQGSGGGGGGAAGANGNVVFIHHRHHQHHHGGGGSQQRSLSPDTPVEYEMEEEEMVEDLEDEAVEPDYSFYGDDGTSLSKDHQHLRPHRHLHHHHHEAPPPPLPPPRPPTSFRDRYPPTHKRRPSSSSAGSDELELPADPRTWLREDVQTWIRHLSEVHGLPSVQTDRFLMNGKALCLMNMDMFCQRVPLGGKMLFKDFQLRLSMAMYHQSSKYSQQ